MDRQENGAIRPSDGTETTISHFIPSVELTGSRNEKLRKLDTLILYLEKLRGSLMTSLRSLDRLLTAERLTLNDRRKEPSNAQLQFTNSPIH